MAVVNLLDYLNFRWSKRSPRMEATEPCVCWITLHNPPSSPLHCREVMISGALDAVAPLTLGSEPVPCAGARAGVLRTWGIKRRL